MSRPRGTLILFARRPSLGRGKRRLARSVGDVAAHRFQLRMLTAMLARLRRSARHCRLALTPLRGPLGPRLRRAARGWHIVDQGRGDLGARMARALRDAPPGPAVLVGSDIPGLERRHVAAALRAVARADFVIGPSADGGYWLVGGRAGATPSFRRGIRWSTAHAREDTLRGFPARRSTALLETLEDVDDGPSHRRWRDRSDRGIGISARSGGA